MSDKNELVRPGWCRHTDNIRRRLHSIRAAAKFRPGGGLIRAMYDGYDPLPEWKKQPCTWGRNKKEGPEHER